MCPFVLSLKEQMEMFYRNITYCPSTRRTGSAPNKYLLRARTEARTDLLATWLAVQLPCFSAPLASRGSLLTSLG